MAGIGFPLSDILSKTLIDPAISGTLNPPSHPKKPTLKRLVLTPTVGTVLDITKEAAPGSDGDHRHSFHICSVVSSDAPCSHITTSDIPTRVVMMMHCLLLVTPDTVENQR